MGGSITWRQFVVGTLESRERQALSRMPDRTPFAKILEASDRKWAIKIGHCVPPGQDGRRA